MQKTLLLNDVAYGVGKIHVDGAAVTETIYCLSLQLPRISISIVEILPKYGCEQLFWAREFDLAQKSSQNVENTQTRQRDYTLLKWFASEEDTDITYKKGLGKMSWSKIKPNK